MVIMFHCVSGHSLPSREVWQLDRFTDKTIGFSPQYPAQHLWHYENQPAKMEVSDLISLCPEVKICVVFSVIEPYLVLGGNQAKSNSNILYTSGRGGSEATPINNLDTPIIGTSFNLPVVWGGNIIYPCNITSLNLAGWELPVNNKLLSNSQRSPQSASPVLGLAPLLNQLTIGFHMAFTYIIIISPYPYPTPPHLHSHLTLFTPVFPSDFLCSVFSTNLFPLTLPLTPQVHFNFLICSDTTKLNTEI